MFHSFSHLLLRLSTFFMTREKERLDVAKGKKTEARKHKTESLTSLSTIIVKSKTGKDEKIMRGKEKMEAQQNKSKSVFRGEMMVMMMTKESESRIKEKKHSHRLLQSMQSSQVKGERQEYYTWHPRRCFKDFSSFSFFQKEPSSLLFFFIRQDLVFFLHTLLSYSMMWGTLTQTS